MAATKLRLTSHAVQPACHSTVCTVFAYNIAVTKGSATALTLNRQSISQDIAEQRCFTLLVNAAVAGTPRQTPTPPLLHGGHAMSVPVPPERKHTHHPTYYSATQNFASQKSHSIIASAAACCSAVNGGGGGLLSDTSFTKINTLPPSPRVIRVSSSR